MKKILIHSIAFSPDGVSTAYLYNDISIKFKEAGYEVVVLTTTPHYNIVADELKKQPLTPIMFGLFYKSCFYDIPVIHVPQKKFNSSVLRMFGFVYWHIMSFFIGLFQRHVDVIISPSPPLTLGLMNIILGKIKKAKVIYNVQEIYPDLLIEEGGLKSKTIIRLLKKLERFVYNHSDAVTTIDQVFYDTIVNRIEDQSKLHVIPNFVDTSLYKPNDCEGKVSPFLASSTSLKLMYAGNIGHAQDWVTLIKLAIKMKTDDVEFFIIGEGVMKQYLDTEIRKHHLIKVHLIPYQARHLMPDMVACADIQFIFMSSHTEGHGFPSKVYTIMACAKPLLVCSGPNTPIINFLSGKSCSILITEKNVAKKVEEIATKLRDINRESLVEMGRNGYEHVMQFYTKEHVTSQYLELINKIVQ